MSYRDVRGGWWAAREGRSRAAHAPLLRQTGRRPGLRAVLAFLAGLAIAWVLVDAGQWLLFAREPALRVDALRGLVPLSGTTALRTGEGRSWQPAFNRSGSVRLPASPAAHRRVLLLGDSESASYAIEPADHYGAMLARRFPDAAFECDAQPNYSMADYIRLARSARGFSDYDLVVIQGCDEDAGHDALDSTRGRGLAVATIVGDDVRVASEPLGWTAHHLGFYNALYRLDAVGRKVQLFTRGLEVLVRDPFRRAGAGPHMPTVDECRWTERPLLVALRGAVVPPVIWLNLPRIHGVGPRRLPETANAAHFMREAAEAGFVVADASGPLFRFRSGTGTFANGSDVSSPGTGHLNADGHRILFATVAPLVDSVLAARSGRR